MEFFLTYIVPVLIMLALAVVFGFLLSFLGEKFTVVRDPKIDEVNSLLAGANCGGCGFSGCDAFANALVEGKADVSMCKPTTKINKDKIAQVLGKANSSEDSVAVVNCSGGNKCLDKFEYQGYGNCTTTQMLAGGNKACIVGCIGKGTCSESCKYNAISEKNDLGVAFVNDKKCITCGACLSACPKKIISLIPRSAKVYLACSNHCKGKEVSDFCSAGCIACGICAKNCPSGAIAMVENTPVFDYKKCTACMICVQKCPKQVIKAKN